MKESHYLVPHQSGGLKKDMECTAVFDTVEDAEDCFVDAKELLWDVNDWGRNCPSIAVRFQLADMHGKAVNRNARKGDHIRIEAQGAAGGFDWVVIEAIEYDDYPDVNIETFAIHLRPSPNPIDNNPVAELTDKSATSTLVIERRVKKLTATYHGRNEPSDNKEENDPAADAWLGLSDLQWAGLIKGFIGPETL